MPSHWVIPTADDRKSVELAETLSVCPPVARVLLNRGFSGGDEARRFLHPSLDDLHDPLLLTGMREALGRLRQAIGANEKILIYGDYDVDGTLSSVILLKAIELAGGSAEFHVPHRLREGYGMRAEVVERAAALGTRLIISVDTGIRAQEVVRGAGELGIDVIVTDHHLPGAELPPALAVINPNRRDCSYPEKNLCGAGVAFKLAQALLATLDWPDAKLKRMLLSFMKLVAIATVADAVPLLGENRVIVKHGLRALARQHNAGLRALMEVSGLTTGEPPTAREIAFQIAPRINAAGRMAHASDVVRLFLTEDESVAREIASQLHTLNQERQQTEAGIVRAILQECEATPVTDSQAALVFSGAGWHRGVVGIVASRLVERFWRPVFVLGEEDEEAQGSGRGIAAFHLLEALESMPDLFSRFGGHRQAAGVGLAKSRVPEFRERLNAFAAAHLTPADFRPQLFIDAAVTLGEIGDEATAQILSLAPFGSGNPPPVFAALDTQVSGEPIPVKEKHLRARFCQNGGSLFVTAWNFAGRAEELRGNPCMDLAFSLEEDVYALNRGWPGWRAILKDVRPAARAAAL